MENIIQSPFLRTPIAFALYLVAYLLVFNFGISLIDPSITNQMTIVGFLLASVFYTFAIYKARFSAQFIARALAWYLLFEALILGITSLIFAPFKTTLASLLTVFSDFGSHGILIFSALLILYMALAYAACYFGNKLGLQYVK